MYRTIIQDLVNPSSPNVRGRITFSIEGSRIHFADIALSNISSEHVTYDYSKCHPILLDRGELPVKLMPHVSWIRPKDEQYHRVQGCIFVPVSNLEYLEWKDEERETLQKLSTDKA